MCVGGVWAFDKPQASQAERTGERPVARLRHGATVTAAAQERDWLKVRPVPGGCCFLPFSGETAEMSGRQRRLVILSRICPRFALSGQAWSGWMLARGGKRWRAVEPATRGRGVKGRYQDSPATAVDQLPG